MSSNDPSETSETRSAPAPQRVEVVSEQRPVPEVTEIDRTPQVGDDGQVYVSDDISEQAVSHGHAPDIQPRAHSGPVVVGQGSGNESIFEPNRALKASVAEGEPTGVALAEMKIHGTLPTLEGEAPAATLVGVTPASTTERSSVTPDGTASQSSAAAASDASAAAQSAAAAAGDAAIAQAQTRDGQQA